MSGPMCDGAITSKRGLLAFLWSMVTIITLLSFSAAAIYATASSEQNVSYDDDFDQENSQDEWAVEPEITVTSRALAFAALWTLVLSMLLSVFGTVVLGWQSPTGQYYTCCSSNVHRTTPLGLGSFIGALLMFANLTLICSVLFGEFDVRDFREAADDHGGNENGDYNVRFDRSSMAFSVLCICLTIMYLGFAGLTFTFSKSVMEEHERDAREESLMGHSRKSTNNFGYNGYIGERFDVGRRGGTGFVSSPGGDPTLT